MNHKSKEGIDWLPDSMMNVRTKRTKRTKEKDLSNEQMGE